ncbi:hypothetical protein ACWCPQ_06800 [Nocardia sp. NPDC001965]
MAESRLGATIAQILRRIHGSVDDAAGILRRDIEWKARNVRRGTGTLTNGDRSGVPTLRAVGADHRKDTSYYSGLYPGRWHQPPVRRVENAPAQIADELERIHLADDKVRWANYDPGLWRNDHRALERWLTTEGPLAPLNEHQGLSCWELICYAAARVGVLDKHQMRELLELKRRPDGSWGADHLQAWLHRTGDWLIPEGRRVYTGEAGAPRPQRGDIVMWNKNAEHVTMATGRTAADGSPEVYSTWNLPKHKMTWDPDTSSYSTVTDAVQVTSIKELSEAIYNVQNKEGVFVYRNMPIEVVFGRGPW